MITYEWDHNDLEDVEKKLGSMRGEARKVLRDAVNKTAVSARKRLLQVAQERYTVKASGFNSRAVIENGTVANPTATIKVKGRTLTMPRYRITRPKSGVKVEIAKGTGLKTVVGPQRIKSFIAQLQSGQSKKKQKRSIFGRSKTHESKDANKTTTQVVQRKGHDRYPLRVLRSPSVPKQIEMVYDGKKITSTPLKKEIQQLYQKYLDQQIERVLNK